LTFPKYNHKRSLANQCMWLGDETSNCPCSNVLGRWALRKGEDLLANE
jgi:hypothetical protein